MFIAFDVKHLICNCQQRTANLTFCIGKPNSQQFWFRFLICKIRQSAPHPGSITSTVWFQINFRENWNDNETYRVFEFNTKKWKYWTRSNQKHIRNIADGDRKKTYSDGLHRSCRSYPSSLKFDRFHLCASRSWLLPSPSPSTPSVHCQCRSGTALHAFG